MQKTILLFSILIALNVQSRNEVDSLLAISTSIEAPDSARLQALYIIAWDIYLYNQPDSAYYYGNMYLDLAKKLKSKPDMANAYNTIGASFWVKGEMISALPFYEQSLALHKETNNKKGVSRLLNNIGLIFQTQGNYSKAIECLSKSLSIKERLGNKEDIASTLVNIGNIYLYQEDFAKALEYYSKGLIYQEKTSDLKAKANTLNNIGLVYKNLGDIDTSMTYYHRSLELYKQIQDKYGMSSSYNNIGNLHELLGNPKEAIEHFKLALKLSHESNDKLNNANALINLSSAYGKEGHYDLALENGYLSLKIAEEAGSAKLIRDAALVLFENERSLGNFEKSLIHFEYYIKMRDSIQGEESKNEVLRQEFQYEYGKRIIADSIRGVEAQKVSKATILAQDEQIARARTQQIALVGGLFLVLLFGGFMYNRFRITKKQKLLIESQKIIVEQKNTEILDSINYAQRLQNAILPSKEALDKYLRDYFIFYKPKDVVSGDFYFMDVVEDVKVPGNKKIYFVASDCTGHGVPGAMVSIVGANGLKRCIQEFSLRKPGEILDQLSLIVAENFSQSIEKIRDGMDIALCCVDIENNIPVRLHYSGANNPLWIINTTRNTWPKNALMFSQNVGAEIKANKQAIGYSENIKPFDTHCFELVKGDTLYIFSDGFSDQFGGEMGKKFKSSNLKKLFFEINGLSMLEQKIFIEKTFDSWKGENDQLDDVCIIGYRV